MNQTIEANSYDHKNIHKNKVHKVLAHSYLFYFIVFLLAFSLDFVFPLKIFNNSTLVSFGFLLLIFSTFLIIWSQIASHKFKKENINKETFCSGPYRYLRGPTNFGIFILMFGFGLAVNSFFIVFFAILSFIITRLTFIKKEEKILTEKYGDSYLEYKKSVRF